MREKKGRVIIVSTHFMDEADVMADRIGIMVCGRALGVHCSPARFARLMWTFVPKGQG
jgi:ABC-type multidrug transport system ATPase subunit